MESARAAALAMQCKLCCQRNTSTILIYTTCHKTSCTSLGEKKCVTSNMPILPGHQFSAVSQLLSSMAWSRTKAWSRIAGRRVDWSTVCSMVYGVYSEWQLLNKQCYRGWDLRPNVSSCEYAHMLMHEGRNRPARHDKTPRHSNHLRITTPCTR